MMVDKIGSTQIINQIENNWKSFLDWGFLNLGGFVNVHRPTTNISNFDLHILKPVQEKNQVSNTVWQSARKDWVHESGIVYNDISPIAISGVYVNNTLYPAPSGNSNLGYSINYPEGKIIFNKPVPATAKVEVEYSFKSVQIYKAEDFPYWREIQYRSLENKIGLSLSDKGDFAINSEHRVQLPAIIIETISRSNSKPFQLGDKSLIIDQDILLHILADNKTDRNNIIDILRLQEDRYLWLYNTDEVIKDKVNELNYNGSKNITGKNYLSIINDSKYKWLKSLVIDINISDITFTNLRMYGSIARITNQLIYLDNNTQPYFTVPSEPINLRLVYTTIPSEPTNLELAIL